MSRDKIKETAVEHFRQFGYHGVRMARIAEEAGIRKQTLAYHFPSKLKLFEEIYFNVVEEEILFLRHYFAANKMLHWEKQLYQLLVEHKDRFLNHGNANFMFTTAFLPPEEAYEMVLDRYRRYLMVLKEEVGELLAQARTLRLAPEACVQVYVTLLDGLDVQLVYEDTGMYEQALRNGWNVFLHGIRELEQ
ncbi:TetR/AcrR family transcriptional regulator [Paenibacillus apis]|uniref:HTH tetR-type domain-containing protein n=1 Tax=Paenibacillus apis TaxID=1792174 RepID=A0A919Y245_9BACL|nr:TetR/AcrR family transcriptional regulator [Paenibacillus apis]GIO40893.1 hypothetical protein J41TS4_06510 [Paenibacillus apis]